PSGVLTRTGLHWPNVSTARPVCTARPSVSTARPVCTARPSVSTAKPVCTARPSVSTARHVYATRPIYPRIDNGNPDILLQDHAVVDSGSSRKDKGPTQEYILLPLQPQKTRIPVEYVAPAAHEIPSKSSPKDNDVQDSKDVADKEGQHQMTED
ncbi:hypothetical protein Tco_0897842, partial [Tanacetum coccineum]